LGNITINISDEVIALKDRKGSGHDFTDPGATKRPIWSADGITFDGLDDFLRTAAFTLNNPV
jgi:hypothetical protein